MLTSGCEYLQELEEQYRGKLRTNDMNFLNESLVKVDEQQVSEMIDRVCNQSREMQSSEQKESYPGITATPEQLKMVAYDSSITRARGIDTDKENFQANKPMKKLARR